MNTVEIIFSPTGGTEKVGHIISRQWSKNLKYRSEIPEQRRILLYLRSGYSFSRNQTIYSRCKYTGQ